MSTHSITRSYQISTPSLFTSLIFLSLLLSFFTTHAQVEQQALWEAEQRQLQVENAGGLNNFCGTNLQAENNRPTEDIDINHRFSQLRGNGTWNLQDGYGGGCDKDCDLTAVNRNAVDCSVVGSNIFKIPVVYTMNTTAGCTTTAPSNTELSAQITIMNDFMICQGIPMEFYEAQSPRLIDAGCVYDDANVTNIPDVVNIYVFSDTGNGTGCNGFAFLPGSTSSPTTAVMSYNCYNGFNYTQGTLNCVTPSLGFGLVLIHEMGHYLGLYHTHRSGTGAVNCDDPTISTDDCTKGDLIADTDSDPDFSGGEIGCTDCTTTGANPQCTFDSTLPNCAAYGLPNTLNNVMSYNNFSGCRTSYSECQKAKMIDALLCARGPQMCDRDINTEFADGTNDANINICVGDAIPTFTATSDCYSWYDNVGGTANALASNSTTFTPSAGTGAGELDVNTPGVYTWYLGDLNEVNSDCRTAVTVTVSASPGSGSGNSMSMVQLTDCSGPPTIALSSDVLTLGENEVIGWWITENDPISTTVTDDASLSSALSAVTMGGALSNPVNHLFESNSGSPITNYSLPFDCAVLNPSLTYYATPLVAKSRAEIPAASCLVNAGGTNSIGFNGQPGKFNRVTPADVLCRPNPVMDSPNFTYCVTVSGYTGTPGSLSIVIRDDNFNGTTIVNNFFAGTGDGNETYCYDQTDMPGYDPGDPSLTSGMTVIVWEQTGDGMENATLSSTLDITYSGVTAIPFPSVSDYTDCLFGSTVAITSSSLPIELSDFSGQAQDKVNVLEWTTATEINTQNFVIERSATGRSNWIKIGERAAAGESTSNLNYSLVDDAPLNVAYYRLRAIDRNDAFVLSNTVVIKRKIQHTLSVYPIPATDNVRVDYQSDQITSTKMTVTDVTGRVLYQNQSQTLEGLNSTNIDISQFASGIYFITLDNQYKKLTTKIIKK